MFLGEYFLILFIDLLKILCNGDSFSAGVGSSSGVSSWSLFSVIGVASPIATFTSDIWRDENRLLLAGVG